MKYIDYDDIEEIYRYMCPYKKCGAENELYLPPEKGEVLMCDECGGEIKMKD
jgi:rRNA maturation endonuclease Nob1